MATGVGATQPNQQQHHQQHATTGTRLAAAIWVSIWAAFFLCQLFPLAYLLVIALASRALLLDLLPAATPLTAAAVTLVVGGACVSVVRRMKALSEQFQLDFSKKHVQHVRGHPQRRRPHPAQQQHQH